MTPIQGQAEGVAELLRQLAVGTRIENAASLLPQVSSADALDLLPRPGLDLKAEVPFPPRSFAVELEVPDGFTQRFRIKDSDAPAERLGRHRHSRSSVARPKRRGPLEHEHRPPVLRTREKHSDECGDADPEAQRLRRPHAGFMTLRTSVRWRTHPALLVFRTVDSGYE